MHPAFSVIFLTTLIGVGQGLFLSLMTAQTYSAIGALPGHNGDFYGAGSLVALVFKTRDRTPSLPGSKASASRPAAS